jgi:hypothetical protein
LAVTALTDGLNGLAKIITHNQKGIQQFATGALKAVIGAVKDFSRLVRALSPWLHKIFNGVDALLKPFGGWKRLLEGLVLIKLFGKLSDFAGGFGKLGAAAGEKGAAGKVGLLRTRLLALGRLGVIGVTILVSYEVAKGAQRFDRWLGGTGFGQAIGAGTNLLSADDVKKLLTRGATPAQIQAKFGSLIDPSGQLALATATARKVGAPGGVLGPQFGAPAGLAGPIGATRRRLGSLTLPRSITAAITAAEAGHGNLDKANAAAYAY